MAVIEFRSHKSPNLVYAICPASFSDASWTYSDRAIHPNAVVADCMDDYPTRHTPYGVVLATEIEDFLYSLALYLKEKGANPAIADFWPHSNMIQPASVRPFHLMEHKDDKTIYFNQYGETSKALKYKHDRRWREVPPWANGNNSPAQIFELMQHVHHNLGALWRLWFVYNVGNMLSGHWPIHPNFVPAGCSTDRITTLLRICQGFVNAFKEKRDADYLMELYKVDPAEAK